MAAAQTGKGVIFDVDGTLVDSNDQHIEAWQRAFASMGYEVPRDRIVVEVGKGGDKLVPAILGEEAEKKDGAQLRKRHTQGFQKLIQKQPVRLISGAVELLGSLRDRGVRTVLATSSKEEEFEAVERSCGVRLRDRVDALVTSDEAEASKPAPDLVQAACDKLGMDTKQCLMVGDTPYDGEASGRAGVKCVGLLCGRQHSEEALAEAGVAAVYRDPADLMDHMDEVLGMAQA